MTILVFLGRISEISIVSLQQIFNRVQLFRYRYLGSFPSDYDPNFDEDTFAIKNT